MQKNYVPPLGFNVFRGLSKNIIFDQKIDLGEGILDMLCYIQEEIEEKNKK